ncbi:MAG: cytochrome c-550 PedF [Pseudomonadota bacterium]
MRTTALTALSLALSATIATAAGLPLGISSVATDGLPEVGEDWLIENPYRAEAAGEDVWLRAVEIGASGYNQNCARCHGLEGISGGLAPDLRFLEAEEYGDEWYAERFRAGYSQGGVTRMPAFEGLISQEAAWAIRTYLEARPDDQAVVDLTPELKSVRDELLTHADAPDAADPEALKSQLTEIAAGIETLSGAPVADSAAFRAARLIDGSAESYAAAAEALTIGLSAAQ